MIRISIYQPADYPILQSWWHAHGWPAVPEAILPRLGVIACDHPKDEGAAPTPIAAAFLYMDNSVGVSMLEWIVTNPDAAPRQCAIAICHVVDFLRSEAKSLGYGVMLSTCKQESLSRLLVRQGFEVTDTSVIHLIATLA